MGWMPISGGAKRRAREGREQSEYGGVNITREKGVINYMKLIN